MKKLINIKGITLGWIIGDIIISIMDGNNWRALAAAVIAFFLLVDYARSY